MMLEGVDSKFNMRFLQLLFSDCNSLGNLVRVIVFLTLQLVECVLFVVV